MKSILSFISIISGVLAASRTSAPAGALVVGAGQKYTNIQDAVNALSTSSTTAQSIFINAGTYSEQVYIPARKAALTIYGYTDNTASYASNKVTITAKKSQADGLSNDESATLRVHADNFKLYNVNIVNSYGKGSQAVALSAYGNKNSFYGCQFLGYQDTILSQQGLQFYGKSLIQGATDFIFGQTAVSWFEAVDIRVLAASQGYITANGRDSSSNPSYYVINKSTVAAASGNTVPNGAYYLGRPWRNYARVVFQQTSLSAVINSAGWHIWNTGDERTDQVTFAEYGNTGTGASGTRASFGKKLSAAVSISSVLGSDYASWVDGDFI